MTINGPSGEPRTESATQIIDMGVLEAELARMRDEHPDEPQAADEEPPPPTLPSGALPLAEVDCPAHGLAAPAVAASENDEDPKCPTCRGTRKVAPAVRAAWLGKALPLTEDP